MPRIVPLFYSVLPKCRVKRLQLKTLLYLVFVLTLLGLCGCTTPTKVVTEEVKIQVSVPCITALPDKPSMPLQNANPDDDIFTNVKKALAEIELRKGYEEKLEALYLPCIKAGVE